MPKIAEADRHTCDYTLNGLRSALAEIVACFPVYRGYISAREIIAEDRRNVEQATAAAKRRSTTADISIFDFLRDVLTLAAAEKKSPAYYEQVLAFAMKFQQITIPVMAKGLEDTSAYIYQRLLSLNEVGGDPRQFGVTRSAFHQANQTRAKNWPHTMLTSSTHDTKRSEDVRARINVLSWINPNTAYEEAVIAFVDALINAPMESNFLTNFLPFQRRIARLGMFNKSVADISVGVAGKLLEPHQWRSGWRLPVAQVLTEFPVGLIVGDTFIHSVSHLKSRSYLDRLSTNGILDG